MKKNLLACVFVTLYFAFFSTSASAVGAALTVLSLQSALTEAIQSMRGALAESTSDVQSVGNSLQANAQNVLADINRILGDKLSYTFDKLDSTELRLVEDAQALTGQINAATKQIIAKTGDEARKTIVEADIAAYNTSYSLPCRDARPRVVASFPPKLLVNRDAPVITLRGNFLRQGADPVVTINDVPARIIERLDNSISAEIPTAVIQSANKSEVLISAKVSNLQAINRSLWVWGLLGCHESTTEVTAKPIALSVLEPPYHYSINGDVKVEYTAYRDVAEPTQPFRNTGSHICDDNYRADRQWCLNGPGTLVRADVHVLGANCSSGFEGTTPSGDRCVLARGKVAGCGAIRGPGNTWLGCRGRGWLNYDITLIRREPYQTETSELPISKDGKPSERSFNFDLPPSVGLANPQPRYTLEVEKKQGSKVLDSFSISHANPNAGPISSRVSGSILSVEIQP